MFLCLCILVFLWIVWKQFVRIFGFVFFHVAFVLEVVVVSRVLLFLYLVVCMCLLWILLYGLGNCICIPLKRLLMLSILLDFFNPCWFSVDWWCAIFLHLKAIWFFRNLPSTINGVPSVVNYCSKVIYTNINSHNLIFIQIQRFFFYLVSKVCFKHFSITYWYYFHLYDLFITYIFRNIDSWLTITWF